MQFDLLYLRLERVWDPPTQLTQPTHHCPTGSTIYPIHPSNLLIKYDYAH